MGVFLQRVSILGSVSSFILFSVFSNIVGKDCPALLKLVVCVFLADSKVDLTMVNEMAAEDFPLFLKNECVPHALSEEVRRKRCSPRSSVDGHHFCEPVSCKSMSFALIVVC